MRVIGIIVAYGAHELALQAAESALGAGVQSVYIWDNTPQESRADWTRAGAGARISILGDGTNWGFGGGINRALRAIPRLQEYAVLLLNPDAVIHEAALTQMLFELQRDDGIVAPRMRYPDGSYGIAAGPRPSIIKEMLAATRADDLLPARARSFILGLFGGRNSGSLSASLASGDAQEFFWVSGFCMLLRGKTLERLRGFDESFFLYFEDVDLCVRAREMGYSVRLVRTAEVEHEESATTARSGKGRHYAAGRSRYFQKHGTVLEAAIANLMSRGHVRRQ